VTRSRWLTGGLGAGLAALAALAALAVAGCGRSAPVQTPRLSVLPRTGLVDRARTITVSGLDPGEHVTLQARTSIDGNIWTSQTAFAANGRGTVDVSRAAPLSGGYRGASVMGPFWSETYRHGGAAGGGSPDVTVLSATTGKGHTASTTVTQSFRGPGVREQPATLAGQGFVGEYFTPTRPRTDGPAVILWGGSEGGDARVPEAELLASHGIPALAIAYFDEPGLPCSLSNIPLEYFVTAIRWLGHQPGINPSRIWAWGVSRGSEPLGLIAAHWPGLLHGLIDESGSSVVNQAFAGNCHPSGFTLTAWTFRGEGVPYDQASGAEGLAPAYSAPATIPFDRFRGPVLLVSGSADATWPSDRYEDIIMGELRRDPAPHVHLNYAHAGHADLFPPYTPVYVGASSDHGYATAAGGTEAGFETAELHDWPAMLRFVTEH
jgi:hypothetical protein